jgi:hypothetical protein
VDICNIYKVFSLVIGIFWYMVACIQTCNVGSRSKVFVVAVLAFSFIDVDLVQVSVRPSVCIKYLNTCRH